MTYTATCNGISESLPIPTLNNDDENPYHIDLQTTYYLFNQGNQFEERTGGWTTDGFKIGPSTNPNPNDFTVESDCIRVNQPQGNTVICTRDKIDLATWNTLYVEYEVTTTNGGSWFYASTNSQDINGSGLWKAYGASIGHCTETLDLSSISDSRYIGLANTGGSFVGKILKVWLE